MLSIHYISITMRIFYIDWQHHWECDWTMNISANAHSKWTDSTNQYNWQTWLFGFQWHGRGIELIFKPIDCFTMRLFHSATFFLLLLLYLLFETTPGWLLGWRFLEVGVGGLPRIGGGALRSGVFTIWCRILIAKPPGLFWLFKRRSCSTVPWQHNSVYD